MILNGQRVQMPADMRQQCARIIAARADTASLHGIFNYSVQRREPPVTELLKVARPPGQKIFTVQTKFS
jgi:hypothetical protein